MLYPIALESANGWFYGGLGGKLRLFTLYPNGFDLRGILGGEFQLEAKTAFVTPFAEVGVYLSGPFSSFPTLEGRAGVNFPF